MINQDNLSAKHSMEPQLSSKPFGSDPNAAGPSSSLGDQLAGWHPEARDRRVHRGGGNAGEQRADWRGDTVEVEAKMGHPQREKASRIERY